MTSFNLKYFYEIKDKFDNADYVLVNSPTVNDIRITELAKKYVDYLLASSKDDILETAKKCLYAGRCAGEIFKKSDGALEEVNLSMFYMSIISKEVCEFAEDFDDETKEKVLNPDDEGVIECGFNFAKKENKEYQATCLVYIFLYGLSDIEYEEPENSSKTNGVYYLDKDGRINCTHSGCEYEGNCNTDCPIWRRNEIKPLFDKKRYDKAILELIDLLKDFPGYADAWQDLSNAYHKNGEYKNSYEAIKKARDLDQDNPAYILTHACAANACHKEDESLELCNLYDSLADDGRTKEIRDSIAMQRNPNIHISYGEDHSEYNDMIRKLDILQKTNKNEFLKIVLDYSKKNYSFNPYDVFAVYKRYFALFRSLDEKYELYILDLLISKGTSYGYGKEALEIKKQYYTKKLFSNEWHRK